MTRSLADERSVGNAGKEIQDKVISCKHGADPPRKSAGRTGVCSPIDSEIIVRCVSAGNGFCIDVANFPNNKSVRWSPR